jgi:hypothetical protein
MVGAELGDTVGAEVDGALVGDLVGDIVGVEMDGEELG